MQWEKDSQGSWAYCLHFIINQKTTFDILIYQLINKDFSENLKWIMFDG